MIIVYNADGVVLNGYNTNKAYPQGVAEAELANVIAARGEGEYQTLSLHDEDDAEIVAKTLTHLYRVENGQVVFGEAIPVPIPPEPEPTTEEMLLFALQEITALREEVNLLKGGSVA